MKKILFFFIATTFLLNAQVEKKYFGVQTHFGQFYRTDMDSANVIRMLDSLSSANISMIRDECYWSNVEAVRGVYSFPPQIDFYISQARARNIEILLILNYNNPLYAQHAGSAVTTDSNRAAFANYCKKVVERYSPMGVKFYEIWNEPNIPMFWDPQPNAQDYAKLLQAVYPAIKSIDSTVTILGCATSPAEGNPAPFINWLTFITQVKNFGGMNYLDAVSVHLYRVDKGAEQFLQTDLNNLISIIGSRDVWLSEIGYPTSTVWPNLSHESQSRYVSRLYLLARNFAQIKSIVYYDLKNDGEESANNEHNFGLLNFNLSHKPAFDGLKTVISQTGNKNFSSANITGDFYKFNFQNAEEKTFALWNRSTSAIRTDLYSKNFLRVRNLDGSTYFLFDKDKSVSVEYTPSPKFITELDSFTAVENYFILPTIDTLVAGESIQLFFRGKTIEGENIFVDSLAVIWQVSDTLATIDSTGRLTARYAGTTTLSATFGNYAVQKTFTILVFMSHYEIEPFNTMNNFSYNYFNLDSTTTLSIADTNYSSAPSSLLINYKFKYIGIDKHRVIFNCNYNLFGTPDSIEIDFYNNGNTHVFGIVIEDADGDLFSKTTQPTNLGSGIGWKQVRIPITGFGSSFNYPIKLKSFIIYLVKNSGIVDSVYSGKILIDNLKLHRGMPITSRDEEQFLPEGIKLYQNYPNPFNPSTIISYQLSASSNIFLKIYDVRGTEVATLIDNEWKQAGYHNYQLFPDASGLNYQLPSGIYFYQLRVGNKIATKKMLLLK